MNNKRGKANSCLPALTTSMKSLPTALPLSTMTVPAIAGAIQEQAGKLGMEQGQQASIVIDQRTGDALAVNDGNPEYVSFDGKTRAEWNHPSAARPLKAPMVKMGKINLGSKAPKNERMKQHNANIIDNYLAPSDILNFYANEFVKDERFSF